MRKESKKMECVRCMSSIDDYLEGKLGGDEKRSFENHLSNCAGCMELVRVQKLADRIIAGERSSGPGFYLPDRIMSRIEDPGKESDSAIIRILRPVLVSVSVAAAIFAGVMIGNISAKPEVKAIPVELTLMNDIAIESVNVLSQE